MIKKRQSDLFIELAQGIDEINKYKAEKITLRTFTHKKKELVKVDAKLIRETRKKLNMSRAVFAIKLHTSLRTLEKWEQGETMPNDQASALILLTRKYPDTIRRLEMI
jgi:putative transcriptional regulator